MHLFSVVWRLGASEWTHLVPADDESDAVQAIAAHYRRGELGSVMLVE